MTIRGRRGTMAHGALAMVLGITLAAPVRVLAQDEAGEKVFKRCTACHAIGEGAKNKVGPELNGLFGRTAGTLPDFNYSDAMKAAGEGGLVWNAETLRTYLENPKGMVPGTKMTFAGLKKPEDLDAVIAYMEQASAGS